MCKGFIAADTVVIAKCNENNSWFPDPTKYCVGLGQYSMA